MRLVALFILVLVLDVHAQQNDSCVEKVRGFYSRMSEEFAHPSSTVTHLTYFIESTTKKGGIASTFQTKVDVLANKRRSIVRTQEYLLLTDEKHIINIVPSSKTIMINKNQDNGSGLNQGNQYIRDLTFTKDSVLHNAKVLECVTDVSKEGTHLNKIRLGVEEKIRKRYGLTELEVIIDDDQNRIQTFSSCYVKESQLQKVTITYKSINTNYQTNELDQPILTHLFKSRNKLQDQYAGYKIIDKRKTNNSKRRS